MTTGACTTSLVGNAPDSVAKGLVDDALDLSTSPRGELARQAKTIIHIKKQQWKRWYTCNYGGVTFAVDGAANCSGASNQHRQTNLAYVHMHLSSLQQHDLRSRCPNASPGLHKSFRKMRKCKPTNQAKCAGAPEQCAEAPHHAGNVQRLEWKYKNRQNINSGEQKKKMLSFVYDLRVKEY